MKTIEAQLSYERQAPKSRAFGVKTADGILIKVWIPNSLIGSDVESLPVTLALPSGKRSKKSKKQKRDEEEEQWDDDEEEG